MKLHSIIPFIAGISLGTAIILLLQKNPEITTKYQVITLEGNTFDLDVKVLITEDTAFAAKYIKENLDSTAKSNDLDARGVTYGTIDGKSPIIWLPHTNDIAVINHELLHATISVMNWANVPLTNDTEEVYTYELQHLSNEFFKQIKPKQ
jgi:hypothetical protein